MKQLWLAALLLPLAAGAAPPVREDAVQILNVRNGAQRVQTEGRTTQVQYHYSDRGRGPKLQAQWTLDAAGLLQSYQASGNNELGGSVDEEFSLKGSEAQWRSGDARGARTLQAPAFYWPGYGVPEMLPTLVRALLQAPGKRLALLPEGEAWLDAGLVYKGKTLYRVYGLDLQPIAVWLDHQQQTVAVLGGWVNTITPAHTREQAGLQKFQDGAEQRWNRELAQRLTQAPQSGWLLLRGARLFDPQDGSVRTEMSVLVRGERIVQVKPDAELAAPDGAQVLQAGGRFLMPGLWDVHKHYDVVDGPLDLAAGITSARDMANRNEVMLARVQRVARGEELGPRIHLAGIIEGVGDKAGPTPVRVDTVAKANAAVDWYGEHGYRMVKVYSMVAPELMAPIAERAAGWGMKMIGHGAHLATPRQFIEAGAAEVSHLNNIALELMPNGFTPLERFRPKGAILRQHVESNSNQLQAMIAWMRRSETVLDPTIAVVQSMMGDDKTTGPRALAPVLSRLPVQTRRQAIAALPDHARDPDFGGYLLLLKALHEAGIPMMPGSDGMAGTTLQHELELWVQAGIAPAQVLKSATLLPAQVMGVARDQGRIVPGQWADMVLIDGDPLANMADIRRVWRTIKGGRVYDSEAIERALGMAPR